jgi:hypothetical protein
MGVSATDLLHFHPYKTTAVHKVYNTNHEEGVNFLEYKLMWDMENGPNILQFSKEAWNYLSVYVKYQRPLFPILIHKMPLRDVKSGVGCAISATRIITPIFFL